LTEGATFALTTEQAAGDASQVSVSYPGLARDVESASASTSPTARSRYE